MTYKQLCALVGLLGGVLLVLVVAVSALAVALSTTVNSICNVQLPTL